MTKQATTFDRAYDAMTKDVNQDRLKEAWKSVCNCDLPIIRMISERDRKANGRDYCRAEEEGFMNAMAACNSVLPLDFLKLLRSPDSSFGHDVNGIFKFLDPVTFELHGFFVPRCAKPDAEVSS